MRKTVSERTENGREEEEVVEKMESLVFSFLEKICEGEIDLFFEFPSRRHAENFEYDQVQDVVKFSPHKTCRTRLLHSQSQKKFVCMLVALSRSHRLVVNNHCITKRDLFYSEVRFFGEQKRSDQVLEDLSAMLCVPRNVLRVVSAQKGEMAGRVWYFLDGERVECDLLEGCGVLVPTDDRKVRNLGSSAKFVLVVEKEATFQRLVEDKFHTSNECVLLTGKGFPDVGTLLILKKLSELKIPIYGLFDWVKNFLRVF